MAPLKATDRCDRCMAQAVVSADSLDWATTLLFCWHHFREHESALLKLAGIIILDHRGQAALEVTP